MEGITMKQKKLIREKTVHSYLLIGGLLISYLLFLPVIIKAAGSMKKRSSFFTEVKVRNAAVNIQKYTWARKEKDEAVACAERWLADFNGDYARIWDMMPSQEIPRSFAVNSIEGCLVCGTAINKYGNYSYLYDKHKIDWKLTCPNCHLTFPTNDFKSYYEGGLDSDGRFNPEKARRHNDALLRKGEKGNLVNIYAVKGLTADQLKDLKAAGASDSIIHRITNDLNWGVDDGMGYHFNPSDKEKYGDPYTYVAYYAHWVIWYWRVMPMLDDLSRAYMFTRYSTDPKERDRAQTYADAAIVMLDRIADLYPEMYVYFFPRNGYYGFPNCGYRWYTHPETGRVIGSVWENTFIKSVMFAYDAVFPGIDHLSLKAKEVLVQKSGNSQKGDSTQIKINFENRILRQVAKAYYDCDLNGNPGMEQSTLALAAVIMDHNPETLHWLNTLFENEKTFWETKGTREGGGVLLYLVDRLSRDGQGDEVSIGYNAGWLSNWLVVARVLDGYHIPDGGKLNGDIDPDLYHNPRFSKLFLSNIHLLLTDSFVPHIGDTSHTGNPSFAGNPEYFIIDPDNLVLGYSKYKTKELAQAVYFINKENILNVHTDIFTKDPERIQKEIKHVIKKNGRLHLTSHNYTAYGLGILRDGKSKNKVMPYSSQRAFAMFYGARNGTHHHADPLGIGYIAYNLDLMPDFGYPNTMKGWDENNEEMQWDKSTAAHNTVSFDDFGYRGHLLGYGKPLHFDNSGIVQVMHVSTNDVEHNDLRCAKTYERTSSLIRINSFDSYLVDFFHVISSRPYTYNFHTAEVDGESTKYNNLFFSSSVPVTYNKNTLRNVRTATVKHNEFSIDWNILDTWNQYSKGARSKTDVHVKITVPWNHHTAVRVGEAVPPTNDGNNPVWLPILMLPGQGQTIFVSVIEPYMGHSKIISIQSLPVMEGTRAADCAEVQAVKVQLVNGRTDYIVNALDRNKTYRIADKFDFRGFFGVYSENSKGKVVMKYINDGTMIAGMKTRDRITGTVIDATDKLSDKNDIIIKTNCSVDPMILRGKYIYVNNDDVKEIYPLMKYNAVYPIQNAVRREDGTIFLDLGDCSVVRGYKDLDDYSKGFSRDFNLGSSFYIPLSFIEKK
ncbi:hypothetical protein LPYR103PRE_20890 [Segatella asaccharophila]